MHLQNLAYNRTADNGKVPPGIEIAIARKMVSASRLTQFAVIPLLFSLWRYVCCMYVCVGFVAIAVILYLALCLCLYVSPHLGIYVCIYFCIRKIQLFEQWFQYLYLKRCCMHLIMMMSTWRKTFRNQSNK